MRWKLHCLKFLKTVSTKCKWTCNWQRSCNDQKTDFSFLKFILAYYFMYYSHHLVQSLSWAGVLKQMQNSRTASLSCNTVLSTSTVKFTTGLNGKSLWLDSKYHIYYTWKKKGVWHIQSPIKFNSCGEKKKKRVARIQIVYTVTYHNE